MILAFVNKKRNFGFSLVEAAIVLGILGIMLASVWAIAQGSSGQFRRDKATVQEVILVANNIRALYQGQDKISGVFDYSGSLTEKLITQGAIPLDLKRPGSSSPFLADHPWGQENPASFPNGSFAVCGDWQTDCGSVNGDGQSFRIRLKGLSDKDCINVSVKVSGKRYIGLKGIIFNGGSLNPSPVRADAASVGCTSATANNIDFVFGLRQ